MLTIMRCVLRVIAQDMRDRFATKLVSKPPDNVRKIRHTEWFETLITAKRCALQMGLLNNIMPDVKIWSREVRH